MKLIVILAALALPLMGGEWMSLFDGKTMEGWTNQGNANWEVKDGALTVDRGDVGLLTWKDQFENYELEVEFKAALGTNSGVFLNTLAKVKDPGSECYEINIAPSDNPFPTGSIVKHRKVEGVVEKDDWRRFRLIVNRGKVTVILDGKTILEHQMAKARPAGLIGLQKNSGKVAFRKIRLRKLD